MPESIAFILALLAAAAVGALLTVARGRLPAPRPESSVPEVRRDERVDSPRDPAALELLEEPVLYVDESRSIVWANAAARGMLGAEEGKTLLEAVRDHELDELVRRAGTGGGQLRSSVRLSRLQRVVEARVLPLEGEGAVLVLADRTEVEHLRQVRRELVANISHELRTPLATLRILVETLIGGAAEDPEARAVFLGKLDEQVEHLSGIVQQGLHLASLESGATRMLLGPVSLRDLAERCVDRMAPQAVHGRISLRTELPSTLAPVQADEEQISRVLTNLLDNAIKWTPPGGAVVVGARNDDECVLMWVRDTGQGIPAAVLPRLFERFYKGDEARTGSGTGLGLAIAKHTVLMHGGRIWAESEEGEGATFFFTLPAAADAVRPS